MPKYCIHNYIYSLLRQSLGKKVLQKDKRLPAGIWATLLFASENQDQISLLRRVSNTGLGVEEEEKNYSDQCYWDCWWDACV